MRHSRAFEEEAREVISGLHEELSHARDGAIMAYREVNALWAQLRDAADREAQLRAQLRDSDGGGRGTLGSLRRALNDAAASAAEEDEPSPTVQCSIACCFAGAAELPKASGQ